MICFLFVKVPLPQGFIFCCDYRLKKESETSETHTIIVDYASLSEERLKEVFARLERILER
ncbi:hypothetical protein [Treponema zioleckii]|uniref:hypothetical protein n=1 Tax=Treponema zioleckii TaxID=331680 RepID=UPI00168B464A|nr:hypothetical protein [Treponema zioleckii]